MYQKVPKSTITKIAIVKTDCKKSLQQVISEQKCQYAINGGLYDMKTGKVNAIPLRINGKTIATSEDGYWCFAWNTGPDICLIHSRDMSKYQNVFTCATMLKDGANTIFCYTPAQGGTRGRTAIGDDKDNVHLFVTTDNNGPLSPTSLRSKMKSGGALNAIMCDCGGSSQGYFNGTYVQGEKRKVSYWICIWTKPTTTSTNTTKCPFAEPTKTVKLGATGEAAKWVQWHLRASTAPELPVDGTFWTKTRTAVIAFQKKYGLTQDGMVGPATRAKMKEAAG